MTTHHLTSQCGVSKALLCACTLILLLLTFEQAASAQKTTDGSTPLGIAPGAPAGSYSLSGFDNINLFNGNLNFRLPLLAVKGRGSAGYYVTLPIERKWIVETDFLDIPGTTNQYRYYASDDWWTGIKPGYGPGTLQGRRDGIESHTCSTCYTFSSTLTRLTFTGPDGTEYDFRDQLTNGQPKYPGFSRGTVFVTSDGSSATFVSDAAITDANYPGGGISPSGYLLLRDGTRYRIDVGKVSWIRDRNGNKLSFAYDSNSRVTTVTDSLNRQVSIVYATQIPGYDQIIYGGFGGATRTITINYDYLQNALRADQTIQTDHQLFPTLDGTNYTTYNPVIVKSVTLPNNGTNIKEYQFAYNSYGELARVVLPTGGAFEYDYAAGRVGGEASGVVGGGHRKGIYRRVVERRVYADGATLESRMTYSRPESTTTNVGYVQVDQYDRNGALLARQKHYFYGSGSPSLSQQPTDYPAWKDGREYQTEMMGADGATVLRRENQTLSQRAPVGWWTGTADAAPPNDPRVTEVLTTIEPTTVNLVSKQAFGYSQDLHNNQTDIYEYDYGAGAAPAYAVRHTQTDFLSVNPANGVNYADPANGTSYAYNDVHLRSLPKETRVYAVNPANGAESLSARAHFDYDQTALTGYSGVVGLCPTFDSAGQCLGSDPAGYTTRGNNTGITNYADAANEATAVTSHIGYDVAGNAISTTDPLGRVSQISYADAYADGVTRNTFAFPTSTISPTPDPTGQHGSNTPLVTSRTYDYWSGLVNAGTDANGNVTYLRYYDDAGTYDPLDRLRKVEYPDGGWVKYDYDHNQYGDYVETRTAINSAQSTLSYSYFDGLGRSVRSFAYDGSQWITSDTQYDALSRVWRTSNPYLSTGGAAAINPSGRWTTNTYDALGRVTAVTTTDGATVSTSYSGNQVTVTDAQGKVRRSVSDALGRLTQVVEDPAGLAYATNYYYDARGGLGKVDQGGQQRFFMYDSLGRLIRARNPEQTINGNLNTGADPVSGNSQWSMAYTYDADGNLYQRTDARGVVTTYTYDNLNRVTQTDYSDGTATHIFAYDSATNGRGRLAYIYDNSTSGGVNSVTSYDAMGRPLRRQTDFFLQGTGWVSNYASTRTYNLAGGVTSQTYPSGHTVTYAYDAAGRLADNGASPAFAGNLGDGTQRTYARGVTYDEASRMREEQFGTDTPLYHKLHYNVRGQLMDVRLSTVAWAAANGEWNWNRGALLNYYSQAELNSGTNEGHALSGAENNGNLKRADIYIPTDANGNYDGVNTPGSYFVAQQSYAYDALNRLASVNEANYNTASGWGTPVSQAYDYDRWGNRQINAAGTSAGINSKQFAIDTATNRVGVPSGQTGTMSYDNAGNIVYDSYTDPSKSVGTRTYDAENRMTSAQAYSGLNGVVTEQYVYDSEGRRARRKLESGETWAVYGFDGELLAEYNVAASPSSPQKEYGYRGGELLITATSGASQQGAQSVTWQNAVGVTAAPGSLTKTGAAGWNSGASSTQSIQSGDGYVEFTAPLQSDDVMCGLSHGDTNQSYDDIDFALYASHYNSDTIFVEENGVNKGSFGTFTAGDKFRVAVEGGVVKYYKVAAGGAATLLYTSSTAPTYPLVADTALYWTGDQMTNVTLGTGSAGGSARTNVAAASQGATASASSYTPDDTYGAGLHTRPADAIDGTRALNQASSGTGYWRATSLPQWLEVDFSGSKSISEIDVYTIRDNYTSQSDPSATETFSTYGASSYDVQYWDGSAWAAITGGSVSGNNLVWRKLMFSSVVTTKIRLNVTGAVDGVARITELEAWGTAAQSRTNVAASSQGATATAQNYTQDGVYPGLHFQPSYANDGVRYIHPPDGDQYWRDEHGLASWVQVDFAGSKTIDEVDVYTIADYPAFLTQADPSSSQTFTQFGATAFDVQYWTGSAWATVPGGSVSGNNLVWKKINFSAVTTTKIRVVVNASTDGVARLAEVEAYTPGTGGGQSASAEVNWLVSDQLGTPRMVVDQTGSLSGIKRHDYLPFGEELQAGTGGRAQAQGYNSNDNTRQKWHTLERDSETGLDYAEARYYASQQGRFTSPDPLLSSGDAASPATWNRYSYALNNPFAFTDPSGLYVFDKSVNKAQRDQFNAALEQARKNLAKIGEHYGLKSDEYLKAKRALDVYGEKDVDNGVTIARGEGKGGGRTYTDGVTGPKTADNPTGQRIKVEFSEASFSSGSFQDLVGHEGFHAADGADWVKSGFAESAHPFSYQSEVGAYTVQSLLLEAQNPARQPIFDYILPGAPPLKKGMPAYPPDLITLYSAGWTEADKATLRRSNIDRLLSRPISRGGTYELTPASTEKPWRKGYKYP